MKILIIGATRGIGKQVLEQAVEQGHDVTVLARNPDKLSRYTASLPKVLRVIKGDILDAASVRQAVAGQEAICLCIGIPPTRKPVDVFSRGTENLLRQVQDSPQTLLIAVTGIGAGDSKGHGGFLYDKVFNPLLLKQIYADKDRQEALIKSSTGRWIIVRPAMLTNGRRTGRYRAIDNLQGVTGKKISRADVADFMLRQTQNPTHLGRTPLLSY